MALPIEGRSARAKEGNDLCAVWAQSDSEKHRYFVRAVLSVAPLDAAGFTRWGLWVEVAEVDFRRIVDSWSDPEQCSIPAMSAQLGNRVPGYTETLGLQNVATPYRAVYSPASHIRECGHASLCDGVQSRRYQSSPHGVVGIHGHMTGDRGYDVRIERSASHRCMRAT